MIVQGSPEWLQLRLGKVTASRVADVMARTKTGWGATRANYMAELVAERLTGNPADRFINDAMRWGTETEPQARVAYEFYCGKDVTQVPFFDHPTIGMSGASPDGLVGESGLVEIKCPNTATHIDTLLEQKVPGKYLLQMQWQMACTGREWCDFVSFDPRLPEKMRFFVRRVERDNDSISDLERNVTEFLAEVARRVEHLRRKYEAENDQPPELVRLLMAG